MNRDTSRLEEGSDNEAGQGLDTASTPGSATSLIRIHSNSSPGGRMMTRKNKLALSTFALVCTMGIIIGGGYIYLQNTFVHEMINRHGESDTDFLIIHILISISIPQWFPSDIDSFEDDDDAPEAHSAIFLLPDTNGSHSNNIHIKSNSSFFLQNVISENA